MEIADIYDLIECYDFDQLTELQKNKVLEQISEKEYCSMRQTMAATSLFFEKAPLNAQVPALRSDSKIQLMVNKPIPLYQVAASVAILLGLFGFLWSQQSKTTRQVIAVHDTIVRHSIDTVYKNVVDTVRQIREQIVYVSIPEPTNSVSERHSTNCEVALCATDIDKLGQMGSNRSIGQDSMWKDFVARIE